VKFTENVIFLQTLDLQQIPNLEQKVALAEIVQTEEITEVATNAIIEVLVIEEVVEQLETEAVQQKELTVNN
jgi:hypothetical protein